MGRLMSRYQQVMDTFRSMHGFLRFGIAVFAISAALDLSYHVGSSFWPGVWDAYLGPDGYYTHLALFFGMVLIVIGVLLTKPQQSNQSTSGAAEKIIERR